MQEELKILLEGTLSCKAAIEAGRREGMILYTDENKRTRDFAWIVRQAKKAGIPVIPCTRQRLDAITGSRGHGGMVLECAPLVIPSVAQVTLPSGFLCLVDGVEDPYNMGSICRTLYAAGCQMLLIRRRQWSHVESTLVKASAGTWEKLPKAMYETEQEVLEALGSIPLVCAHRKEARPLFGYVFPDTFCLALGGALRGVGKELVRASAQNLYIPYLSDMRAALDTPAAAAVFAFYYAGERYETENQ